MLYKVGELERKASEKRKIVMGELSRTVMGELEVR